MVSIIWEKIEQGLHGNDGGTQWSMTLGVTDLIGDRMAELGEALLPDIHMEELKSKVRPTSHQRFYYTALLLNFISGQNC